MKRHTILHYDELITPVGPITILTSNQGLCRIDYGKKSDIQPALEMWINRYFPCSEMNKGDDQEVKKQLTEYFAGDRKNFSLSIHFNGTQFQKKVWNSLLEHAPYGETRSYKDIAEMIQAPKAVRAVGGAVNKNPIAILVPCHRVIGSNGSLVGYNGGLKKKQQLLRLEKAPIDV